MSSDEQKNLPKSREDGVKRWTGPQNVTRGRRKRFEEDSTIPSSSTEQSSRGRTRYNRRSDDRRPQRYYQRNNSKRRVDQSGEKVLNNQTGDRRNRSTKSGHPNSNNRNSSDRLLYSNDRTSNSDDLKKSGDDKLTSSDTKMNSNDDLKKVNEPAAVPCTTATTNSPRKGNNKSSAQFKGSSQPGSTNYSQNSQVEKQSEQNDLKKQRRLRSARNSRSQGGPDRDALKERIARALAEAEARKSFESAGVDSTQAPPHVPPPPPPPPLPAAAVPPSQVYCTTYGHPPYYPQMIPVYPQPIFLAEASRSGGSPVYYGGYSMMGYMTF